jgi:hypothetical protein
MKNTKYKVVVKFDGIVGELCVDGQYHAVN